jgi:predicted transposase YbfD/YdcC
MRCTQKKTANLIIDQKSDYLMSVKGNQKRLLSALKQLHTASQPVTTDLQKGIQKGRIENRLLYVYQAPADLQAQWPGLQSCLVVSRSGYRDGIPYWHNWHYISSLPACNGPYLNELVRGHWQIENCLHRQKDVVLREDASLIHDVGAAINLSLLKDMSLNLLQLAGHTSLQNAIISLTNKVKELWGLFTKKAPPK